MALVPFLLLVQRFAFVCDDAYISFRYARHLVEGIGLRFNASEVPAVEGYSNLLWILWLAPFEFFLPGRLPLVSMVSSAVLGSLLLLSVLRLARRRLGLSDVQLAATGLVLACLPPFFVWSTGGLETMACSLAVFLVFERLSFDPDEPHVRAAGLAAVAAVLTRADGAVWVGAALVASAIASPTPMRALAAAVRTGLFVLAAVALQLAFRVGYHDAWIPNTARVKAGFSFVRLERGAGYLASLLLELPVLALLPLVILSWARARHRLAVGALAVCVLGASYSVFVGGDFMTMGRFLVPTMAFVGLGFAALTRALGSGVRLAICTALVVASGLAAGFDRAPVPSAWRQRAHFRWNEPVARSEAEQWRIMRDRAEGWARVGRALGAHSEPGESIVLPNLGAISYYSEVHAFDPFGLISPEVAERETPRRRASPGHDLRVEPSFFFDREPDYLGAWISPAAAPGTAGLPRGFAGSPLGKRTRLERKGPQAGDGLAAGEELRLLRLVWDE